MTNSALAALLADARVFSLPLKVPFRGVTHREGVLISGPSGTGEFAPFLEYDDVTCARWLASAVEAAWGHWPVAVRNQIPTNAIIPALAPHDAAELAYRGYLTSGCQTVKIKVAERGGSLDADIERVAAVRSAQASAGIRDPRIRIDANGAWSVEEAAVAIRELDAVASGLEYVEQPCATLAELAQLRRRVGVPIAADESIRTAGDPIEVARTAAADVIVVKVPPLAGVNLALQVCEAAAVPVVVSSAMDSSVGLSAGLALAAALPELPYACGLGTGELLADDLVAHTATPSNGYLQVDRAKLDDDALERATARVSDDRKAWWLDRIERAWEAGAGDLVGPLIRP